MGDLQPVLRQWMLLRILSARRYGATVRQMAEETGASQKSIPRDIELLQQAGFTIEDTKGERGRKSWKCSQANGQRAVYFNLTELASLYLGRRYLEPLAGTDFWQRGARRVSEDSDVTGRGRDPLLGEAGRIAASHRGGGRGLLEEGGDH